MTHFGVVNLLSAVYLSLAVSFAISLNENRRPARIAGETARRWLKLLGAAVAIGLLVELIG